MMFKKAMADLILAGKKTQTRRMTTNKRIYKVGSIQPIQMNYFEKAKHHIKILRTYEQTLGDMVTSEVEAEGFDNWVCYMDYLRQINPKSGITEDLKVRVYEFALVAKDLSERRARMTDLRTLLNEELAYPDMDRENAVLAVKVWLDERQQSLIPWDTIENKAIVDYLQKLLNELLNVNKEAKP
jgi:hypothetical protein